MMLHIKNFAIVIAVLAGVAITFRGLYSTGVNLELSIWGFRWLLLPSVVFFIVCRFFIANYYTLAAIFICIISFFVQASWPLITVIALFVSSYAAGNILCRLLRMEADSYVAPTVVGVFFFGTIVSLSSHYPVNYPGTFAGMVLLPLIFERKRLAELFSKLALVAKESNATFLDFLISTLLVLFFLSSCMPDIGADSLAMHLKIPAHIAYWHHWHFDVTLYNFAVMPALCDFIYAIPYMFSGETGAKLVNFCFVVLICLSLREFTGLFKNTPNATRYTIILALTIPLTLFECWWLYIELGQSLFLIIGVLHLFKLSEKNNSSMWRGHLFFAAAAFGGAMAIKAVSLVLIAPFALFFLYKHFVLAVKKQLPFLVFCFGVFALGFIPYIYSYYVTDNPVFPFFNGIFKSEFFDFVNFSNSQFLGQWVQWDTLYDIVFFSSKYVEGRAFSPGCMWLILYVPVFFHLLLYNKRKELLLFVLASVAAVLAFKGTAYLRYGLPVFLLLCAVIGASADSVQSRWLRLFLYGAVVLTAFINMAHSQAVSRMPVSWEALISEKGRDEFLSSRKPVRSALHFISALPHKNTFFANFSSSISAEAKLDTLAANWHNGSFALATRDLKTAEEFGDVLPRYGAKYILLNTLWGTREQRESLRAISDELTSFGRYSVLKIKNTIFYDRELLKSPTFDSTDGWHWPGEAITENNNIILPKGALRQRVEVAPLQMYLMTAIASRPDVDDKGTVLWLKIDWYGEKKQVIDYDILECATDNAFSAQFAFEVTAPPESIYAMVYVVNPHSSPLVVESVSFKSSRYEPNARASFK